MNYIILFATGIINKNKASIIRLLLSSIVGSVYAILSYMSLLEIYASTILKILLSISMIYIAFKPYNLKSLCKQLLIFYLTSFTFGGVAFALLYFVRPQDILMKNGVLIGMYPIKIALLGGIVGFTIITIAFKTIKGRLSKKDMLCYVKIMFNGKEKQVKALIDTGNLLKEPITGVPVIIVEKNELFEIFPNHLLKNLEKIIKGDISEELNIDEYISKFRVIPFMSLGKENGMLLGIKTDKVIIQTEEKIQENENVIIGIYDKCLTKNGTYTALVGLDIFEGGKEYEYNGIAKREY